MKLAFGVCEHWRCWWWCNYWCTDAVGLQIYEEKNREKADAAASKLV